MAGQGPLANHLAFAIPVGDVRSSISGFALIRGNFESRKLQL